LVIEILWLLKKGMVMIMDVLFYGKALEYTQNERSYTAAGAVTNIRELIDELGERYGEGFKAFLLGDEECFIVVNDTSLKMTGGLNTPLIPGDKVKILPFIDAG
jgi:molybdopterin converting factor small subunit